MVLLNQLHKICLKKLLNLQVLEFQTDVGHSQHVLKAIYAIGASSYVVYRVKRVVDH